MSRSKGWLGFVAVIVGLLAGCGGGAEPYHPGGVPVQVPQRVRLPALSQDIAPSGPRSDQRSQNLFPSAQGDYWVYNRTESGVSAGTVTRTVTRENGNDVELTESGSTGSVVEHMRRTPAGRVDLLPDPSRGTASQWAALPVLDVPLLVDAEPFYDFGMTRRVIRQGDWGRDQDGDGVTESFRFEYGQQLVNQPVMSQLDGTKLVTWHFLNQSVLTVVPSDMSRPEVSLVTSEHVWWAPGVGMTQRDRTIYDTTGAIRVDHEILTLKDGQVGGQSIFIQGTAAAAGGLTKIALAHNDLIFDPVHGVYYASMTGLVVGHGNSIATIDPASGTVSYSASLGAEPGPLALSADGSALYVGLSTGAVSRLAVPGLRELYRRQLPGDALGGMRIAVGLSVSPLDPGVVAVAMIFSKLSSSFGGIALFRGGNMQPLPPTPHDGVGPIVFSRDGQYVYGLNTLNSEFGLRRYAVLANGLSEDLLIAPSLGDFGTVSLTLSAQDVVLERSVYQTPGLNLLGTAPPEVSRCRAHTVMPNRLVCRLGTQIRSTRSVAVVDASTFALLATPLIQAVPVFYDEVIPGPPGQVALRFVSGELWLMNSPDLP